MKIALHSYQLGTRGTEICLYKYAKYLQQLRGHECIIVSTSSRPTPTLSRFEKEFETFLYPDVFVPDAQNIKIRSYLQNLVKTEKVDFLYAIKGGEDDGILKNMPCRTGAHCIFRMDQPHGDVYAGVCEYISEKHGKIHPWVDHIVDYPRLKSSENLREELNIPENALVGFRHGGSDTFNLGFTHSAIKRVLDSRDDMWFIFLNTKKFIDHPRVKYLEWTPNLQSILKFVNTGDFFMHARYDGEIFPLTCAEAATQGKPIVTWNPLKPPSHYDTGHIKILKDRGLYYTNDLDLYALLLTLDKKEIQSQDWDVYKDTYSPEAVITQFENIFLGVK